MWLTRISKFQGHQEQAKMPRQCCCSPDPLAGPFWYSSGDEGGPSNNPLSGLELYELCCVCLCLEISGYQCPYAAIFSEP